MTSVFIIRKKTVGKKPLFEDQQEGRKLSEVLLLVGGRP